MTLNPSQGDSIYFFLDLIAYSTGINNANSVDNAISRSQVPSSLPLDCSIYAKFGYIWWIT